MIKTIFALTTLAFASSAAAGPVNINTADAATLDAELHGVGPVIAQRIIQRRETHGAFAKPRQLMLVRGVGEKTFARNAGDMRLQ